MDLKKIPCQGVNRVHLCRDGKSDGRPLLTRKWYVGLDKAQGRPRIGLQCCHLLERIPDPSNFLPGKERKAEEQAMDHCCKEEDEIHIRQQMKRTGQEVQGWHWCEPTVMWTENTRRRGRLRERCRMCGEQIWTLRSLWNKMDVLFYSVSPPVLLVKRRRWRWVWSNGRLIQTEDNRRNRRWKVMYVT